MCVCETWCSFELEQEEPPVSSTRTVNLGGKWRERELVCARQNAWSILCGAGAWASMGLWSKANTETTRSHNGAHKLRWEGPQLSVAFWSTARPLTHIRRWKWRVHIHTLLPCPDINECNYSRIFAFKEWEEGREGNVTLRAPSLNSQVCIMGFCRNILGRVYMYLPRCNIGEGGRARSLAPTIPVNITHTHITSACLLCCITGSKAKRPSPKIKKLFD